MRWPALMLVLLGFAAAGCGSSRQSPSTTAAAPPQTHPTPARDVVARLAAPTHTPKVGTRWPYSVRVTSRDGKPLAARITVQIVDPLGGVHPVQLGLTKVNIVRHPFVGTFRDFVIWPRGASVATLVFRATVVTARGRAVVRYSVKPHV